MTICNKYNTLKADSLRTLRWACIHCITVFPGLGNLHKPSYFWLLALTLVVLFMGAACSTGIHFRKPTAVPLTTPTQEPLASSTQSSSIATGSKSFPSVANVVARATPAVVSVVVFREESSSFSRGNGTSGSGFIFDDRGRLIRVRIC